MFVMYNKLYFAAASLVISTTTISYQNFVVWRYYHVFWPWKPTRNVALWILWSDLHFAFVDAINPRLIDDFPMLLNTCYIIHISSLFLFRQILVTMDLFSWFITIIPIHFVAKTSCTIDRFHMLPMFLVQCSSAPSVQTFTTKKQFCAIGSLIHFFVSVKTCTKLPTLPHKKTSKTEPIYCWNTTNKQH